MKLKYRIVTDIDGDGRVSYDVEYSLRFIPVWFWSRSFSLLENAKEYVALKKVKQNFKKEVIYSD